MTIPTQKLLQCPFCGDRFLDIHISVINKNDTKTQFVATICQTCGATGPTAEVLDLPGATHDENIRETEKIAIDFWNTRNFYGK